MRTIAHGRSWLPAIPSPPTPGEDGLVVPSTAKRMWQLLRREKAERYSFPSIATELPTDDCSLVHQEQAIAPGIVLKEVNVHQAINPDLQAAFFERLPGSGDLGGLVRLAVAGWQTPRTRKGIRLRALLHQEERAILL
jgi:hypothetical protein